MVEQERLPISHNLLKILRCPVAIKSLDPKPGLGQLSLVHGCWLISTDSGLKYPIINGIPVMLVKEGLKWKDIPVEELPVPPPHPDCDTTS